MGPYILDFYCPSELLAVELDGDPHFNLIAAEKDHQRDEYLRAQGVKVLRFENQMVFNQLDILLLSIKNSSKKNGAQWAGWF